jgi:epoxyqueuosine reductase
LGLFGKNSCLISPKIGSAFLLAEVFLDQPLKIDQPFAHDHCGTCERCVKACPTACIQPDRTIDARRCISYHTIENRGEIPSEIMERSGNWFFGCDICQMVCPWNTKHISYSALQTESLVLNKDQLLYLLTISDEEFLTRFGNTSLSRTKKRGLMRNALIQLGNMADRTTLDALTQFVTSATDPLLIQTAQWAINQME